MLTLRELKKMIDTISTVEGWEDVIVYTAAAYYEGPAEEARIQSRIIEGGLAIILMVQ